MYCAGAPALIINSIAARQIKFSLIVHPPSDIDRIYKIYKILRIESKPRQSCKSCLFPLFQDVAHFQLAPLPPDLQNFRGERAQLLFDFAAVFQPIRTRIAARQRERACSFARRGRNARDHLIDVELRRPKLGLHPFQRASRFGVAFRNCVEQSPANESRAEERLAVFVLRVAPSGPHHAAGRRATTSALLVAATADVEDAARREETVERRDQFSARQPVLEIWLGFQPFSFRAGAANAKHEFALAARLAEFDQLITARGPCAARLAD